MSMINFSPPSYRAAASDLTIAVSPLGLVELADEEFEVHGPRLNRYAANWAWYLGHHWAYRKEIGEPQLTFNYIKAFADYITNFTFGRGVEFHAPEATSLIIPPLLKRVWEIDNNKTQLLWELGQLGGVSGDAFIKVAYEEPYVDPSGMIHPGRVRILPLNPAFCFPEFHPHDRSRMNRFKLKYKFWGCVDSTTEILTADGWKHHWEVQPGDDVLGWDPETDTIQWEPVSAVNVYPYEGPLHHWTGRVDALTTPNHRWMVDAEHGNYTNGTLRYEREERWSMHIKLSDRLILGGGAPLAFADQPKWSDELVETVAWYVTEGSDHINQTGYHSVHLSQINPKYVGRFERLERWWKEQGASFNEMALLSNGVRQWYLGKGVVEVLRQAAPSKRITPEFLRSLTYAQAVLFLGTLMDGDGARRRGVWTQVDQGRLDGFQMLEAMFGVRTRQHGDRVQEYGNPYTDARYVNKQVEDFSGQVWCPSLPSGFWCARRNGYTYWTGNTAQDGTRQVFTYVELVTDVQIEEYVNDELIDRRENPMGEIPIIHITNIPVASSPWGLADITDIISLNREYNEKATNISDIINYHAAPVTVIIGAKAGNLEKGPKKIWAIGNEKAKIENLELETNFAGPLGYLEMIKRSMHEMTGVPEGALGQQQPVSNTSGVALQMQWASMMHRYHQKRTQYTVGFKKVNELAIKYLALYEPDSLFYNPSLSAVQPDVAQLVQLDPMDPVTYRTDIFWPDPMPMDRLLKINEIQALMAMSLESRKGALRDLGEQYPDQKLREIFEEMLEDLKEQGALDMIRMQISQFQMASTGMTPDGQPIMMPDGGMAGAPPVDPALVEDLMSRAYQPMPPQVMDYESNDTTEQ